MIEVNPVVSMAGAITPGEKSQNSDFLLKVYANVNQADLWRFWAAYHAIQSRWKQIRGQEYRPPPRYLGDKTSHIPASSKHKHDCQSAPKELLRPPNPRQTAKKLKPPETPEESPRSAGVYTVGIYNIHAFIDR